MRALGALIVEGVGYLLGFNKNEDDLYYERNFAFTASGLTSARNTTQTLHFRTQVGNKFEHEFLVEFTIKRLSGPYQLMIVNPLMGLRDEWPIYPGVPGAQSNHGMAMATVTPFYVNKPPYNSTPNYVGVWRDKATGALHFSKRSQRNSTQGSDGQWDLFAPSPECYPSLAHNYLL